MERPADCYFQEYIDGESLGAVFVGNMQTARLLGVTSQLICEFRYGGSIGPLPVSVELETQFARLGNLLAAELKLRGIFGVDAILADDVIYPLEVNPRYTASVEILERCCGFPAIELHVAGCLGLESRHVGRAASPSNGNPSRLAGKLIVYATADSMAPAEFGDWAADQNRGSDWPQIADIPPTGTIILAGRPICTVLAAGLDQSAVTEQLDRLAVRVFEWVRPTGRPANPGVAKMS